MKQVNVKICLGTACVVLGGLDPQTLIDLLHPELAPFVEIEGSTCLSYCKKEKNTKPPFVLVGDVIIGKATYENVLLEIKKQTESIL